MTSDDCPVCRICYSPVNPYNQDKDLIKPCNCKGSVAWVHHTCLSIWRYKRQYTGDSNVCEQCEGAYNIQQVFGRRKILIGMGSAACMGALYFSCYFMYSYFITLALNSQYDTFHMYLYDLLFPFKFSSLSADPVCVHASSIFFISIGSELWDSNNVLLMLVYTVFYWRSVAFSLIFDCTIFILFSFYCFFKIYKKIFRTADKAVFYMVDMKRIGY